MKKLLMTVCVAYALSGGAAVVKAGERIECNPVIANYNKDWKHRTCRIASDGAGARREETRQSEPPSPPDPPDCQKSKDTAERS